MYGWINECIKCMVVEKFGVEMWAAVAAQHDAAAEELTYSRYEYYTDESTIKLVSILSGLLDISPPAVLEAFGAYFIQFCHREGYSNLLQCLGNTLLEWLSNINMLHVHLSSSMPKISTPHFRCINDTQEPDVILLYYSSPRGAGLEAIVVGIVKEVSRSYFQLVVQLEQLETQDPDRDIEFSYWRIRVVEDLNESDPALRCSPVKTAKDVLADALADSPAVCPFRSMVNGTGADGSKPAAATDVEGLREASSTLKAEDAPATCPFESSEDAVKTMAICTGGDPSSDSSQEASQTTLTDGATEHITSNYYRLSSFPLQPAVDSNAAVWIEEASSSSDHIVSRNSRSSRFKRVQQLRRIKPPSSKKAISRVGKFSVHVDADAVSATDDGQGREVKTVSSPAMADLKEGSLNNTGRKLLHISEKSRVTDRQRHDLTPVVDIIPEARALMLSLRKHDLVPWVGIIRKNKISRTSSTSSIVSDRITQIPENTSARVSFSSSFSSVGRKKFGITSSMLMDLYPYHVVFDKNMQLLQTGASIEKLVRRSVIGENLLDYFIVANPCTLDNSETSWAAFVQETEDTSAILKTRHINPGGTSPIELRGPVMFCENESIAMVLCVPNVASLTDMTKQGLKISDIPKHDFHLQMIMLSEHLSSATNSSSKLATMTRELEVERARRMAAMKRAAALAEASLATKKTFVRYVSHEIRTPLTISKVGLDLIDDELQRLGASETMLSTVQDCQQSMEVAVSILNDLLNYEKLEGGIMDIYRRFTPLVSFVEKTIHPFNLQAKQKNVDFKLVWNLDFEKLQSSDLGCEELLTADRLFVLIDESKMSQVLRNLSSNALKFTDAGGSVAVELTLDDSKDPLIAPEGSMKRGCSSESESIDRATLSSLKGSGDASIDTLTLRKDETEKSEFHRRVGVLIMKVIDNGAGIKKSDQRLVFDEIVQFSPNELQAGGGTGLGLWISKRICDLHESSIKMTSAGKGFGSTFILKIPLFGYTDPIHPGQSSVDDEINDRDAECNSDTEEPFPAHLVDIVFQGLHILLVDDARMILKVVSRLLVSKGAICTTAEDGEDAIRKVERRRQELSDKQKKDNDNEEEQFNGIAKGESNVFDAILMDFIMPVCDGPTATQRLREDGYSGLIIGVTGNMMPFDIHHFKTCGANDVLGKPVDINELAQLFHVHRAGKRIYSSTI